MTSDAELVLRAKRGDAGLTSGQSVSYHITGQVDLLYDCGSGGPGGPSYPVRGPVDFSATRAANAEGTVAATIAVPPPANAPTCTPSTQPAPDPRAPFHPASGRRKDRNVPAAPQIDGRDP